MTSTISRIIMRQFSSSSNSLLVEKIGQIVTIGINRPEKRNSVDSVTSKQLKSAIEEFENDDSLYAAVLYGTGGNFCAGFDLKEIANSEGNAESLDSEAGLMGPTLRFIKKPIVAALSGYAVAGGLELALMCDLRVVEETAILGVYSRRFGVPLSDGGTVRLQAMIGLSRALDLILTGRALTAKEAFEWGVANRIVACGTALGQAINLATSLIKFPQASLRADRNSTYNAAFNAAFNDLVEFEQDNGRKLLETEAVVGAKRFMDGIGRHGKTYNLTEKIKAEWEKEFQSFSNSKCKL